MVRLAARNANPRLHAKSLHPSHPSQEIIRCGRDSQEANPVPRRRCSHTACSVARPRPRVAASLCQRCWRLSSGILQHEEAGGAEADEGGEGAADVDTANASGGVSSVDLGGVGGDGAVVGGGDDGGSCLAVRTWSWGRARETN